MCQTDRLKENYSIDNDAAIFPKNSSDNQVSDLNGTLIDNVLCGKEGRKSLFWQNIHDDIYNTIISSSETITKTAMRSLS